MTTERLKWPAAYSLALSDDGRLLACMGGGVVVIDLRTRTRVSTGHPIPHPSYASFSPDGKLLAVKSTSGRIVLIDPETGATVRDFKNQREGEGSEVHFSPTGLEVIDGSWDGSLTVRRASDGIILMRHDHPGEMLPRISHDVYRCSWLVQHSPKFVGNETTSKPDYVTLHRWPFADSRGQSFTFGIHIKAVILSPDGATFAFIQKWDEPRIHIARTSDGQIIASSAPVAIGPAGNLAWSPDGQSIGLVTSDEFIFYRSANLEIVKRIADKAPQSVLILNNQEIILGSWRNSKAVGYGDIEGL